jgi:hypothetical protein
MRGRKGRAALDRGRGFGYKAAHAEVADHSSANYQPGRLTFQPPGLPSCRWPGFAGSPCF